MLLDPLNTDSLKHQLSQHTELVIACYCAQWCGTCKGYRTAFAELSQKFPQYLFVWIDIEDHPDLLDDLDVENFPTLLIQKDSHNYFFGTMLPHINHLERMIQAVEDKISSQKVGASVEGPADLKTLI